MIFREKMMKFFDRLIANSNVFKAAVDAMESMAVKFNNLGKIISTIIQTQQHHQRALENYQQILEEICMREASSKMSRDNSFELNVPLPDDKKASNKPN